MNIQEEIVKRVQALSLPDAEQIPAVESIRINLLDRIGVRIAEDASEEVVVEFNRIAESDEVEALQYLDSQLPNFQQMVIEELDLLVDEYALLS
jgi:hypothetical protein